MAEGSQPPNTPDLNRWWLGSIAVAVIGLTVASILEPEEGWPSKNLSTLVVLIGALTLVVTFHVLSQIEGHSGLFSLVSPTSDTLRWTNRLGIAVAASIYPLGLAISLLYLIQNSGADRFKVSPMASITGVIVSFLLTTPIHLRLSRQFLQPAVPVSHDSASKLAIVEKSFVIVGIIIGLYSAKVAAVSLNETARANLSQSRGQLYAIETAILTWEAENEPFVSIYLKAPTVDRIDLAGFDGSVGSPIKVEAHDDCGVMGVTVAIRAADNTLIEEGPATYDAVKLAWEYTATQVHPESIPATITATAVDRPGGRGSLTENWGPLPSE